MAHKRKSFCAVTPPVREESPGWVAGGQRSMCYLRSLRNINHFAWVPDWDQDDQTECTVPNFCVLLNSGEKKKPRDVAFLLRKKGNT